MSLFKSGSEKLRLRLEALEAEAVTQETTAAESRKVAAEADARAAEALADGELDVTAWRKRRAAAEAKASEADAALKATRDAAEIVRGRLEAAQAAELLASLQKRYAAVQERGPAVVEEFRRAGRAFSDALGRLEWLSREETSVIWHLRQAGDRETQTRGVPLPENLLADELVGPEDGRKLMTVTLSVWPSSGSSS